RRYFLDKTPGYHVICEEIIDAVPHAKFIFLWRNPLAVASSLIETFGHHGRWQLYDQQVHMYDGLRGLIRGYHRTGGTAHAIRYEDLVREPGPVVEGLERFLDLQPGSTDVDGISAVSLRGRMKDPTGIGRYDTISSAPLDGWRRTFRSPLRR